MKKPNSQNSTMGKVLHDQLSELHATLERLQLQVATRPDDLGVIAGSRLLCRLVDLHHALEVAGSEARLFP